MSPTRRQFIKEAAVAGALTTAAEITLIESAETSPVKEEKPSGPKCPYFDQPMYCNELSEDGVPLCEKDKDK